MLFKSAIIIHLKSLNHQQNGSKIVLLGLTKIIDEGATFDRELVLYCLI